MGVTLRGVRDKGVLCDRVWAALDSDERDVRRGGQYMVERIYSWAWRPQRVRAAEEDSVE